MKDQQNILTGRIVKIVRDALERGAAVEIDGLGTFRGSRNRRFKFVSQNKARVFIAYVDEDLRPAKKLYQAFEEHGFRPWLDKKKLMPGQNWPRAIETAIQTSDFFVACFSRRSTSKRGSFHSELRYALTCAARIPLDEIFFIPLRLDECTVPRRIAKQVQYVDLFPEWEAGVRRVIAVMRSSPRIEKKKPSACRLAFFLRTLHLCHRAQAPNTSHKLVEPRCVLHLLLAIAQPQKGFRIVGIPSCGFAEPVAGPLVVSLLEIKVSDLEIPFSFQRVERVFFGLKAFVFFRRFLLLDLGFRLLLRFFSAPCLAPTDARQKQRQNQESSHVSSILGRRHGKW